MDTRGAARVAITSKQRSFPTHYGSEFVSRDLNLWAYANDVMLDLSRPGKPTDNGNIEAFNSKYRAKCLNAHWFLTLADAREKMDDWPHSAIGYNGRSRGIIPLTSPARHRDDSRKTLGSIPLKCWQPSSVQKTENNLVLIQYANHKLKYLYKIWTILHTNWKASAPLAVETII